MPTPGRWYCTDSCRLSRSCWLCASASGGQSWQGCQRQCASHAYISSFIVCYCVFVTMHWIMLILFGVAFWIGLVHNGRVYQSIIRLLMFDTELLYPVSCFVMSLLLWSDVIICCPWMFALLILICWNLRQPSHIWFLSSNCWTWARFIYMSTTGWIHGADVRRARRPHRLCATACGGWR